MHPARKKRLILILFILCGTAIAATLALFALKQNINLYYTPSQVAMGKAPAHHLFRIGGLVEKGSIHHAKKGLAMSFVLTDTAHDITVNFAGILPDLFREGQGIVVQGKMGSNGQFKADQVLAKHGAKYMPQPVLDALKAAQAAKQTATRKNKTK